MCVAVRGLVEVGSYEHDGLFLFNPHLASDDERGGALWRTQVLERIRSRIAAPVDIKDCGTLDDALTDLRAKWPTEDWDTIDDLAVEGERAELVNRALADTACR